MARLEEVSLLFLLLRNNENEKESEREKAENEWRNAGIKSKTLSKAS